MIQYTIQYEWSWAGSGVGAYLRAVPRVIVSCERGWCLPVGDATSDRGLAAGWASVARSGMDSHKKSVPVTALNLA